MRQTSPEKPCETTALLDSAAARLVKIKHVVLLHGLLFGAEREYSNDSTCVMTPQVCVMCLKRVMAVHQVQTVEPAISIKTNLLQLFSP